MLEYHPDLRHPHFGEELKATGVEYNRVVAVVKSWTERWPGTRECKTTGGFSCIFFTPWVEIRYLSGWHRLVGYNLERYNNDNDAAPQEE